MITDARFAWTCAVFASLGHLVACASIPGVSQWRLWLNTAIVVFNMGAAFYCIAVYRPRGEKEGT